MSYRREDISNAIWDDEDFDALSNDAALLYLWSFTNPRCGMAGVYRVTRRHLCEGRLKGRKLDGALAELRESRHLFFIDGVLWVRTRVKHLRTKGEPMKKSILNDLKSLPADHPIVEGFVSEYRHSWIGKEIAAFEDDLPKPLEQANSPNPSRTPLEPLEGFQGKGKGYSSGKPISDSTFTPSTALAYKQTSYTEEAA